MDPVTPYPNYSDTRPNLLKMRRPSSKRYHFLSQKSIPIELTDSPIVGRVSKIGPASAIPEEDTTVGNAGVGTTAKRIESNALGTLNLV